MSILVSPSGDHGPHLTVDPETSEHDDEDLPSHQARTGTFSLFVGVLAVTIGGCPWLPAAVFPVWLRYFPLYLIMPLGISALISGIGALHDMRGWPTPARRRARAGIALGAVAVIVPVGIVVWGVWVLSV
ncbi:hypothetical protein [Streptomyces sp. NPDC004788]